MAAGREIGVAGSAPRKRSFPVWSWIAERGSPCWSRADPFSAARTGNATAKDRRMGIVVERLLAMAALLRQATAGVPNCTYCGRSVLAFPQDGERMSGCYVR